MGWEDRIGRRLKLRDVHILLAVVQSGSMAKAAERLAVSQPVVSKTVADLEHTLGVRLLDRGRKGIEVTPFGQALLSRGIAAFDELRQGVKEIEFLADPTAGEVRIAGTPPMVAGLLPLIVQRLRHRHPKLAFQITETYSGPTFYHELRQRTVDFVIGRMIVGRLERDLDHEILFEDPALVAVGTQSRWTKRRKIELIDLIDDPWILPRPDTVAGAIVAATFRAQGLDVPSPAVITNCLPTMTALLATGSYLAILPQSFTRYVKHRPFKILPVQLTPTEGAVSIVTLKNRTLSPAARLTAACIREVTKPLARA